MTFLTDLPSTRNLTLDMDMLRSVCMESEIVEYKMDLDGIGRVRCKDGWEKWTLPLEERDPSARGDGPRLIFNPPKALVSEDKDDWASLMAEPRYVGSYYY
jgi:la-related protein 1